MAFDVGSQLGRYTILKQLAGGGMADVLLARASGMDGFAHHVVIKRIRADQTADSQALAMFLDEARLCASLHHHHIVQVHEIGREGDDYFFAMEYVHGEDLRRLLTRVAQQHLQVPFDQIVTIGVAVAAALHHAHEQKGAERQPLDIVHRDVSPANILVGYDGNVKVLDFGIAKGALRTAETREGTLRGKVAYMAPEQCIGRDVDRRSDVFALGIVLYELCTARRLFKGDSDYLTMSAIVAGKIPRPSQLRTDLPPALERIIMKALSTSPAARYQTAEHLGLDLERAAARSGLRLSSTALAAYLGSLFGRRAEPWLTTDPLPEEVVDRDFDGTGEGIVVISDEDLGKLAAARALLDTPSVVTVTTEPSTPTPVRVDEPNEFSDEPRTEAMEPDELPTQLTDATDVAAAVEAARLLRTGSAPKPAAPAPAAPVVKSA
ncbi:MAG: serine/threonine protein kinase, partial [Myxococcota bacterium]|nr:serine/threonine protein kinase [Myxococcota bacterium]